MRPIVYEHRTEVANVAAQDLPLILDEFSEQGWEFVSAMTVMARVPGKSAIIGAGPAVVPAVAMTFRRPRRAESGDPRDESRKNGQFGAGGEPPE